MRTIICSMRLLAYIFMALFYLSTILEDDEVVGLYFAFAFSVCLVVFEILDVIWCFWLIEIVFYEGKLRKTKTQGELADYMTEDLESRTDARIKNNFIEKDSKGNPVIDQDSFPFSSGDEEEL